MYLGNLLIFDEKIATISDIKYVVIREKKHFFSKTRYYAFPGQLEVLVGNYEVTGENRMPILVNAEHLHDSPRETKISSEEVKDIILKNNDVKKLAKLITQK